MEKHLNILELAAQDKLPDKIDSGSNIPINLVRELVDEGYLKAIDASSADGITYLNPKITFAGREYLSHLKKEESSDVGTNNPNGVDIWKEIESEYDISKRSFGKRINFVKDDFKRKILFRDIEQAYMLAQYGFNKPSVILAGSIIEELLRLYLLDKNITPPKNTLDSYIKICEEKGLLKRAISQLADSIRQFRNIVHIKMESSSRHSISKPTAKGAVSFIFTIANDFDT